MAMAGQAFDSPHGRLATLADVLCGWQRRRNGGGSSTHCFEPRVMLAALKLHSQVRRRVDMRELILLCLDIVHTEPVKLELQRRLASGDVAVPGYKARSEACMKLDLLAMQWARHQSSRLCVQRYVLTGGHTAYSRRAFTWGRARVVRCPGRSAGGTDRWRSAPS